jgi:RimJ/RimL family protein N-acetyltransferase
MAHHARKMTRASGTRRRVALGPITIADAPTLFEWINDRDLVLFNSAYRPTHETSHLDWMRGVANRKDLVVFAVRTVPGKRLIGVCQLTGIDAVHRRADLQIRMGDDRTRGRGLGLEAVRQLLAYGFDDLNLHRIALQVFATNTRAITTYERAGFRREGTLKDAMFLDGQFVDVLSMAILAREFRR